ncbi:hypothetical protein GCM10028808_20540 [Spirosoma migulaei]
MSDIILYWNAVAIEANRISHTNRKMEQTGPTLSSRALAIVHIAMHDSFVATTPGLDFSTYMPLTHPVPAGATARATVSAAAHATLWALFPSQRTLFDTSLAEAGEVLNPGHELGLMIAKDILTLRAGDPGAKDDGYTPSLARGKHKVDPDNPSQGFYSPFYGAQSGGFAITTRHTLLDPPFQSPAYTKALRQVREKGIATSLLGTIPNRAHSRTNDETVMGLFWAYDGAVGLGTPPRFYNQIIRTLAIARNNTEAQNARLFALVNVAMGDAGILAWDEKYRHNFWRPIVGIREHDQSMGMATAPNNNLNNDCDCNWLPLGGPATNAINPQYDAPAQSDSGTYQRSQVVRERPKNFTPNFPAYPSGHATFGAAALHITRLFYGALSVPANTPNPMLGNRSDDHLFDGLSVVSEEMNGVNQDNQGTVRPRHVRNFPGGLWRMIVENGLSRVYLGVHWLFDAFAVSSDDEMDLSQNIGGVPLGLTIAEDIYQSGMHVSPPAAGPRIPPTVATVNHR